jgi:hypothetical protein
MTVTTYHATFKDGNGVEYVASVQWDKHSPHMLDAGIRRLIRPGEAGFDIESKSLKNTPANERRLTDVIKRWAADLGAACTGEEFTEFSDNYKGEECAS